MGQSQAGANHLSTNASAKEHSSPTQLSTMIGHAQIQELQKQVEEAVTFVRKEGFSGTAQAAGDIAKARLEDAKQGLAEVQKQTAARLGDSQQLVQALYQKLVEIWESVLSSPQVQKALDQAKPVMASAWSKYLTAHDSVAASPYYHRAVDLSKEMLTQAQGTKLYQAATSRVYEPYLSPYMTPALDRVTASPQYAAVIDHLKPLNPNQPLNPSQPAPVAAH